MSWRQVALREVGQIVGGGTPKTSVSENFGDDYAWITPKDLSLQKSRYVSRGARNISSQGLMSSSAKLLPVGTVLLSSRAPIGLTAIAAQPVTTNQGCRSFIPGPGVDSLFMYYLLGSMKPEFERRANGSTFKEISGSTLAGIEISLPSFLEQRTISATLGALDDKIESNRRAVGKAQELGDALFTSVTDERRVVSEIATITMGTSPKGDALNEVGDGVNFYQGTRDFGFRFPSQRIWTTNPIRFARRNDTLMSVRAPVGELNRALSDCCVGRGVAAIHSEEQPSTLYYAMRASRASWNKFQGDGTVFASVNKQDVHGTEILWISSHYAEHLEQVLSSIDSKIESLETETERLISIRETLLPALLSGSIPVPVEGVEA